MPCKHAVATLWNMASFGMKVGIPESWVHLVYKLETWKHVYSFKVFPINGQAFWPKSQVPTILTPPKHHKPVGRPKMKRKRSAVEMEDDTGTGKLSRKNVSGACSKCKMKGHNSRTCTGQPPIEGAGRGRGAGKGRGGGGGGVRRGSSNGGGGRAGGRGGVSGGRAAGRGRGQKV